MRSILIAVITILVVGAIAGAFLLMNNTQSQTQQVKDQAMQKDVSKEAMREKDVPKDAMQKDVKDQAMIKKEDAAMMEKAASIVFKNVNGGQVSLLDIQKGGKPTVIYFFATWCPVCDADLKTLNSVYEKYHGKVDILVVGFDPSENSDIIKQYAANKGYSWNFAEYNRDALLHFKIITQATKIGLNSKGSTVFTDGYGVLSANDWTSKLDKLLA